MKYSVTATIKGVKHKLNNTGEPIHLMEESDMVRKLMVQGFVTSNFGHIMDCKHDLTEIKYMHGRKVLFKYEYNYPIDSDSDSDYESDDSDYEPESDNESDDMIPTGIKYYMLKDDNKVFADVVVFDGGKTIVSWRGEISSIVIHDNLENFKKISVNNTGKKLIVFGDMLVDGACKTFYS